MPPGEVPLWWKKCPWGEPSNLQPETMPTALVTGANRGIGREVARRLAADHGYAVLLTARDLGNAKDAADDLQTDGLGDGRVTPLQLDVTDDESLAAARDAVEERFGRLDALVNNAGIDYDTDQDVLSADLGRARRALDTNTLGPWRVVQALLPLLRAGSGHACIANVSSGAGAWGNLGDRTPAYSLSKAALNALTVMMADALSGDDVLVNAVGPGWVRTRMGGENANRSVAEGARSVVWGVTLPADGPTGGFFRDGERIDW